MPEINNTKFLMDKLTGYAYMQYYPVSCKNKYWLQIVETAASSAHSRTTTATKIFTYITSGNALHLLSMNITPSEAFYFKIL